MKTRNRIFSLGLLLLVLALATSSLVSGTFAKYVTTANGTGAATVAKWDVSLTMGGETVADAYTGDVIFDLFETFADTGVDGKKLAPGTEGSFNLIYDTTNTEVAHNITLTLEPIGANNIAELQYLKFYKVKGTTETEIALTPGSPVELINENLGPTEGKSSTISVKWVWPFENSPGGTANDANDTDDGIAAKTYNFKAVFTATQLDAAP